MTEVCSRLVTLYQTIHDALHAKSGQAEGPVKLQLIRTDTECVMGWVSPVGLEWMRC